MAKIHRSIPILFAVCVAVSTALAAPKKKPRTATVPEATPVPAAATPPPAAPGELPLYAAGAIVLDGLSGKPLYEKNADQPFFPASTTKVMTALLIIEAGDLDHEVECTLEDSKIGESSLNLKAGQRYSRRQMLYGLMLKSANDVAYALGRDNAGTAEAFAEKMTRRARELGATNTNFKNPNGLHDRDHYTSARDLALIARAAMQQPLFRQIVSTRTYTWQADTGPSVLTNHNRMLTMFPGCTGVKTGFTNPAQHTLVTAAMRGGYETIAVVLYDTRQGKWDDCSLLLSFGLDKITEAATNGTTAGN